MPFGFDGFLWRLMGEGIDWMITVALFVAGLPGAVGRVTAFGTAPLLLCTSGLLLLCLLRSPLRWTGAAVILASAIWAARVPQPDVFIADRGDLVALRGPGGRLSVMRAANNDGFALREWLAADADVRGVKDPSLGDGIRCDQIGCVGRLADGSIVTLALAAEAFEEDCRRAALIVSQRTAPQCAARTIDRTVWPRAGATALYRTGKGWDMVAANPPGYDRPWARPPRAPIEVAPATPSVPVRDATPQPEALAPDD
jgi:competence protein ComEC